MISPDLIVLLIIGSWSGIVAFFFYWRGYSAGRQEVRELERELDAAIEAITAMAVIELESKRAESKRHHPAARPMLYVIAGDLA